MKTEDITVLIVENDPKEIDTITNVLITQFQLLATNINSTCDTRTALAMIQIEEPHIVFVDFHLSSNQIGYGDGALLLKEITEKYRDNSDYMPFRVAISSQMSEITKKSIDKYCDVPYEKNQLEYPSYAFQRFLMSLKIPFNQPQTSVSETAYMHRIISLIEIELTPYGLINIKKEHQAYIIELICFIIPTIDKRTPYFDSLYKEIAKKYNISSSKTIKTAITRAYKDTFIQAPDFFELYTGNNGEILPKQKNFFLNIASCVKKKL